MLIPKKQHVANKIMKSYIKPATALAITGSSAYVAATDENKSNNISIGSDTNITTMCLWDYLRMYKILGIPIIDLLLIYLLLYTINHYWWHYEYKSIIVLSLALTIFVEYVLEQKSPHPVIFIIIFSLCIVYLVYSVWKKNSLNKIENTNV
jgi:Ca2+/Na+ antiporter